MKEKISIIFPFLNEADNLLNIKEKILDELVKYPSVEFELIFVDDGSSDDSIKVLNQIDFGKTSSKLISLTKNFGSHAAIFAGIKHSNGDYITILSSDFQDDVGLVLDMYRESQHGFDIVLPLRKVNKTSFLNKLGSSLYTKVMRSLVIKTYPKKNFDLFFFKKKVKKNLIATYNNNSSLFVHIITLGYKLSFIEYERKPRLKGKSRWTLKKKFKLIRDSIIGFTYAPIRLVTLVGFLMFLFGIFWSLLITFRKLFFDDLLQGWAMTSSLILIGFGITNISLGILAEYLWRTLDASRKSPIYIIDSIKEFNA